MLSGSRHAMLLIVPPDQGPDNQVFFWPDDRGDHAMLSHVARVALRDKKPVIKPLSTRGGKTGESTDVVACPLFLEDQLLGVGSFEVTHRSFSRLRAVIREVQAGARWIAAMKELSLDPALVSEKRDQRSSEIINPAPEQNRWAKWLGPRFLTLKMGTGLTAFLLGGFFLMSTLLRFPSESASQAITRHKILAHQQNNTSRIQVDADDSVGKGKTVKPDQKKPPIEGKKTPNQGVPLPREQSQTPTESKQTEVAADPDLSDEKIASPILMAPSDQEFSGTKDQGALNLETAAATTTPIQELYSIEVGPVIGDRDLKKASSILHSNGLEFQQTPGIKTVTVTRLLEGLYTRVSANKRLKEIQEVVDSPFILSEKGKFAVYVATYHDRKKANQKIKQLAQKNIQVTAVTTELQLKGTILVVKKVDGSHRQKITDQMSKIGLSVKAGKPG
jgi:hypothetical protein